MDNFITDIDSCLNPIYQEAKSTKQLAEDKAEMVIGINAAGVGKHLIYSFDLQSERAPELFPFFSKKPKLKQVSDYVIFCIRENDAKPFALIIELKSKKGKGKDQLKATDIFVQFLIQRINFACDTGYEPETRKIEISKNYKGFTRPSKVSYNDQKIAYVTGNKFVIADYLL